MQSEEVSSLDAQSEVKHQKNLYSEDQSQSKDESSQRSSNAYQMIHDRENSKREDQSQSEDISSLTSVNTQKVIYYLNQKSNGQQQSDDSTGSGERQTQDCQQPPGTDHQNDSKMHSTGQGRQPKLLQHQPKAPKKKGQNFRKNASRDIYNVLRPYLREQGYQVELQRGGSRSVSMTKYEAFVKRLTLEQKIVALKWVKSKGLKRALINKSKTDNYRQLQGLADFNWLVATLAKDLFPDRRYVFFNKTHLQQSDDYSI